MSPLYGYKLAHKDSGYPGQVRHFGLGLIEEAVRFRWNDGTYGPPEREKIRNDIIDLVSKVGDVIISAMPCLRSPSSHCHALLLFVTLAGNKRWYGGRKVYQDKNRPYFRRSCEARMAWTLGGYGPSPPRTLCIWGKFPPMLHCHCMWPVRPSELTLPLPRCCYSKPTTQELVLIIHRVLTEDIFIRDDVVAEQRKKDLQTAMICSVASARVLKEQYPAGPKNEGYNGLLLVRGDPENVGWLARWTAAAEDYGAGWEQRVGRVLVLFIPPYPTRPNPFFVMTSCASCILARRLH
ncbi:hypothetical protein BC938DRAFT_479239 [Jimgerdemannia flammicorona]|uniref:Uncharacterized protein n=1 Tax=Jimgerdemannia flammicorona TaxID=994334 RepID=A0A433QLC3_9FUNG|nr:hypothetical protein BC938DRAFT_479239 [Jimgerdemannia flammicorona]